MINKGYVMSAKIRCGDEVIVLTGINKGQRGKVKYIFSSKKIIVEGVNIITKHQKAIPSIKQLGGIVKREALIDISNVAIFNFNSRKADKIGFVNIYGKKSRVFKSTKEVIK